MPFGFYISYGTMTNKVFCLRNGSNDPVNCVEVRALEHHIT